MTYSLCLVICTCERPTMLRECLSSINDLNESDYWKISVLVVDNSETCSSEQIITDIKQQFKYEISLGHEETRGIPFARNKAIEICQLRNYDWIAFVDDDEILDKNWLGAMATAHHQTGADVLHGLTESRLEASANSWPMKIKRRNRLPLQFMHTAGTDNVVFRNHLIHPMGMNLSFDKNMRFTGGEDKDFFYRAYDQGAKIVWVPEAKTYETVPASRQTFLYQISRAQSVAANDCYIQKKRKGLFRTIIKLGPKALGRLIGGSLVMLFLIPGIYLKSRTLRLQLLAAGKQVYSAIGTLKGFMRAAPQRYTRIHGR